MACIYFACSGPMLDDKVGLTLMEGGSEPGNVSFSLVVEEHSRAFKHTWRWREASFCILGVHTSARVLFTRQPRRCLAGAFQRVRAGYP